MDSLKDRVRNTLFVRAYTFMKIPLIWWVRPSILEMGRDRTIVSISLSRRTRNHLHSMYFGALAIGSELVVAAKAVQAITNSRERVDYVFKDFSIQFLKRAEGDVHFICEQGGAVEDLVKKTIATGERETQTFNGYAIVPKKDPTEKVITFSVTLSVKKRTKKTQ